MTTNPPADAAKLVERLNDIEQLAYMGGSDVAAEIVCIAQESATLLVAQVSQIEALTAEVETLQKWAKGQWFYNAEDPEHAFYDPSEVIDFIDLESGHHVIEVAVSASLPSIWCAVRVTDDDNADERFTHTEHSSEAEARAALDQEGGAL